jgi:hypothetical protein
VPGSLEQAADLPTSSDDEIRGAEFLRWRRVEGRFGNLPEGDSSQGPPAKVCWGTVGRVVEAFLFAEAVEAKEVVPWNRLQLEQVGDPEEGEGEGWEVLGVDQLEEEWDSSLDYALLGPAEEQAKETGAFD